MRTHLDGKAGAAETDVMIHTTDELSGSTMNGSHSVTPATKVRSPDLVQM